MVPSLQVPPRDDDMVEIVARARGRGWTLNRISGRHWRRGERALPLLAEGNALQRDPTLCRGAIIISWTESSCREPSSICLCGTGEPEKRPLIRGLSVELPGIEHHCRSRPGWRKRRIWQRETTRKYVKRPRDARQALTPSTHAAAPFATGNRIRGSGCRWPTGARIAAACRSVGPVEGSAVVRISNAN
jgi:hypothetical protein